MSYSESQKSFLIPSGGASLILSFRLQSKTTLILGSGSLAASRTFLALEADSKVIILAKGGITSACEELKWRAQRKQIAILDLDSLPGLSTLTADREAAALESVISETSPRISFVCVTDTVLNTSPLERRSHASAAQMYQICQAYNIPANFTDMPEFCDFSFTSSHRFEDQESGERTALQIGVTTNGRGCRLAGRLRREIVAKLPQDVGTAVEKIATFKTLAKAMDTTTGGQSIDDELCEDSGAVMTPNQPVPIRSHSETSAESARRRMKWVAQVSEYWPLPRLAKMTEQEMLDVLKSDSILKPLDPKAVSNTLPSLHSLAISPSSSSGKILLVGSGPGHPSLLTLATHTALTRLANLVLSDKLVPAAVLALIPSRVQVRIARKFPGNADGAQIEMMEAAVEAARRGLTVVRLKQGDPVVYGRAGEEVLYFRSHGFEPVVVPGVSSALAGPTFAGIPITQRGVAESFIVCTGVGRQGKEIRLPGYERGRTLVILMGVARLTHVIAALVDTAASPTSRRDGPAYPPHTPIALIERASMPDQRVISSTLRNMESALESVGEQRPPGLLIVGWAVLALWGKGDVEVLEDHKGDEWDQNRVHRWLGGDAAVGWRVREGLDIGWQDL